MDSRSLYALTQNLCLMCMRSCRGTSVFCQRCSDSRYCSRKCLEDNRSQHKELCDFIVATGEMKDCLDRIFNHGDNDCSDSNNESATPMDDCDTYNCANHNSTSDSNDNNDSVNRNNNSTHNSRMESNSQEASSAICNTCTDTHSNNGTLSGESFGRGWWKGRKKKTGDKKEKDGSKSPPKRSCEEDRSKPGPPAKTQKRVLTPSSRTTAANSAESFGSGWWNRKGKEKENDDSTSPGKRSAVEQRLEPEPSAKTQKKSSTPKSSSKTSASNSGDDFGTGWWKGGNQGKNEKGKSKTLAGEEKNSNSSVKESHVSMQEQNSHSESVSDHSIAALETDDQFTSALGISIELSKIHLRLNSGEKYNTCTDIVVWPDRRTKELIMEFKAVLKHIADSPQILKLEAQHGRMIVTQYREIPCLYKASLGGSRRSVVGKIVGSYKGFKNTFLVQDDEGVTSPVAFDMVIDRDDEKCLVAENFVLLPGAFWEVLPDGYLGIRVTDEDGCHFFEKAAEKDRAMSCSSKPE